MMHDEMEPILKQTPQHELKLLLAQVSFGIVAVTVK